MNQAAQRQPSQIWALVESYVMGRFFLQKRNGLLSSLCCHTQREESNPLGEITLELRLVFEIPESGLTINGLIGGLKQAVGQIHGAILESVMKALEERLIEAMVQSDPERYRRNGSQSKARYLKSSLGAIPYRFAQLRDQHSGRSLTPLVESLAIPAYDHYLEEALEPGIGLSVHVSYRRASGEVERIGGQSISHTTVHRRLQEFAASHDPFGMMKDRAFRFLVVDGTKVHLQGPLGKDLGQVEMRWALASLGSLSRFEPVGFWIDTEWAEIRKDLERRLDYQKLEVLFCDGGPGIEENLLHPGMKPQRYPRTRTYIENLMAPVTTFLKHWLENNEVIPLTTNAIENAFSQVSNRIKRVGRRWSETGLLNWLKVTFYKIFKPELWTTLWNGERDIPKIKLISLQISWHWSDAIT